MFRRVNTLKKKKESRCFFEAHNPNKEFNLKKKVEMECKDEKKSIFQLFFSCYKKCIH